MGRAIAAISGSAAGLLPRPFARLGDAFSGYLRSLHAQLFSGYHPELHYMRGPGPKWRAKYGHLHGNPKQD
jgi:hypothetical protein